MISIRDFLIAALAVISLIAAGLAWDEADLPIIPAFSAAEQAGGL